jgi:hypothetical protein
VALYEVVLRFEDRPDEVRLHDRPLPVGRHITILGREWVAAGLEAPTRPDAAARVVLREDTALRHGDETPLRLLEVA